MVLELATNAPAVVKSNKVKVNIGNYKITGSSYIKLVIEEEARDPGLSYIKIIINGV